MVCVCVCVCARARVRACACACVNNVLNIFPQKKKSDEVRSRPNNWELIDHCFDMCRMTKEFHTEIKYVTIRNFYTSLRSTNCTVTSFIF
jgi:hypothetical protein